MRHRVIPPRLHVLLARESETAVVFRRGPSRHMAVYAWDRSDDTVRVGQWLKGRIYERRCDLSPDGRHLIYFAADTRGHREVYGGWTAISRAPYLKALTLLAKGDSWHGGGLFTDNTRYWLNDGYGHEVRHEVGELTRDTDFRWHERYGGECPGVYYIRLQRDGWRMAGVRDETEQSATVVFEKPLGPALILRRLAHAGLGHPPGRGVYHDTHELVRTDTGAVTAQPDWEWADRDGERLAWAAAGRLFAAPLQPDGPGEARCLHDFATAAFERIEAPY